MLTLKPTPDPKLFLVIRMFNVGTHICVRVASAYDIGGEWCNNGRKYASLRRRNDAGNGRKYASQNGITINLMILFIDNQSYGILLARK